MPSMFETVRAFWRISAVRQAITSALLFVLITGVVAGVAFFSLQTVLMSRIDATLESRAEALLADTEDGEIAARVEAMTDSVDLEHDPLHAFLVDGETVAGTTLQRDVRRGFSTVFGLVESEDDEDDEYDEYDEESGRHRVLARLVDGGTLVVAEPLHQTDENIALIAGALLWGGLFAAAMTVAVGLIIGMIAHRRIKAIEAGLNAIAAGELDRRLPESRRRDDIDRLSIATNHTLARLQASVTALRDLSANIAHDLKTPITRLHQRLSSVRTETDHVALQQAIDEATAEAARIGDMFDAVLRISQIEAGARRERFADVDLAEVVRRTGDLFQAVAEESGRPFHVRTSGTIPVTGDVDLLVQAASNLLSNAFRHTPPATPVDIEARISRLGPVLSVADRGPGIAASERERVLQPFYRIDKSRTDGGTGLGLALVRAVADLHGADLALNDRGPGLVACVTFPQVRR
ncbi:MAG: sensor histidine kinase [Alphaproteobacteria bacterium]